MNNTIAEKANEFKKEFYVADISRLDTEGKFIESIEYWLTTALTDTYQQGRKDERERIVKILWENHVDETNGDRIVYNSALDLIIHRLGEFENQKSLQSLEDSEGGEKK